MFDKIRWTIRDGKAVASGIDFGNGSKPIEVWKENAEHIVFKIPAGKHWVGRGMKLASHPGKFLVCKIVEMRDGWTVTETLIEMPVSKRGGN